VNGDDDREVNEAKRNAKLSRSKYSASDVTIICFTEKKDTRMGQDDRLHMMHLRQPRRKTSQQNALAHK